MRDCEARALERIEELEAANRALQGARIHRDALQAENEKLRDGLVIIAGVDPENTVRTPQMRLYDCVQVARKALEQVTAG